jgi:hypothetical protein
MANNTAQLGFARLGLMSFGQYGRNDTVARAITDSSVNGKSNYFIAAWVQEPVPATNPLFDLLNKIDECLQDLENRTPRPVMQGSTEVEKKSITRLNSLDRVNCRLNKLRKKKEETI